MCAANAHPQAWQNVHTSLFPAELEFPLMARPHIYGRRPATVIGHSLCMYVHGCCDVYSWAVYAHALLFDVAAMVLLWFGSGECSTQWLGVMIVSIPQSDCQC